MSMTARDFADIRKVMAYCNQALDQAYVDGFVDCFTADGTLETTEQVPELGGTHTGREALRAFAEAQFMYSAGHVRHSGANHLIRGDGATASAVSYVIVSRDNGAPLADNLKAAARVTTTGMVFDDLVKIDGKWLIAKRKFSHDGTPEVLGRLRKRQADGQFS